MKEDNGEGEGGRLRLLRMGVHFYLIGLITLTLGIALAVLSMLGTSAFDALLVGLFRTFDLTIGSWEIVVGVVMVLGNALAEKKRPEYFALITSFITGVGIDSWLYILRFFVIPEVWISHWVCLILSIILTGLGIAIYLQSEVAPNPMDRSMLIVAKFTGWNMTYSRLGISILLVITAFFFDGAIGIGTLLNAIFVGMVINFLLPHIHAVREAELEKLPPTERKLAEGE